MSPAPLVRRFRPEDAAPTRTVFFKAVREGAADHYSTEQLIEWAPSPAMPEGWGEWLDRNFTVVAEHGDLVTGFFMLEPSGYLNMAFVLPAWRRTGVADRLHAAILAEARTRGMPRLTVWASRLARRFLARNGWVIDPDPPKRAGHPVPTDDPEPIDYPMKLELAEPT